MKKVKSLHQELTKYHKNYKPIIEELSEYFLYGDKQDEDVFDYLAEKNILSLFYDKLKVADQQLTIFIIERISMIITNVSNPLNLNYLLSNSILHEFINHKYDFTHPEIVDYYVNFLKTIAIRINRDNFYLYFNQRYCSFPLLWQAQKFISYPDNLVKNTIQNIILSLTKLASDPEEQKQTQSVIFQQTKIMTQFQNYLSASPFIEVYVQYLIEILKILRDLKNQEQLEIIEDYIMFFNDLIVSCPFLSQLLEKIIADSVIQPILESLYQNQKNHINLSYEVSLFTIYLFLTKLPLCYSILSYFLEDQIYVEEIAKINEIPPKWQYCTKHRENEFQFLFSKDQDQVEKRTQYFLQKKQQNLIKNPFKETFLLSLRSKDSTILYLLLQIIFVSKINNYQIPAQNILMIINNLEEVVYSKHLIELIVLLLLHEDLKEIEQIYQQLNDKVLQMFKACKNQQKKLSEGLIVNWQIIEEFNWNEFQNLKPTLNLKNLQPYNDDPRLGEFKLVYLWFLMGHLVGKIQHNPQKKLQIDQEFSHLNDGEFIQVPDCSSLIVIEKQLASLIYTKPTANPNISKIKFVQPLKAIECSFKDDKLFLECSRLSIHKFETCQIKFHVDTVMDVINIIYNSQCQISEQILIKLESLLR